jgi:hypothetical protein
MMKSIGVALITFLCIVDMTHGPAVRRIPPVDEGTRDPSFASYRQRLLHAATHRDVPAVLSMVASRVRFYETGLPETKQAFARRWKLFTDPGPFLDTWQMCCDLADDSTKPVNSSRLTYTRISMVPTTTWRDMSSW